MPDAHSQGASQNAGSDGASGKLSRWLARARQSKRAAGKLNRWRQRVKAAKQQTAAPAPAPGPASQQASGAGKLGRSAACMHKIACQMEMEGV